MSALNSAALEDVLAVRGAHPNPETVGGLTVAVIGLVRSLHLTLVQIVDLKEGIYLNPHHFTLPAPQDDRQAHYCADDRRHDWHSAIDSGGAYAAHQIRISKSNRRPNGRRGDVLERFHRCFYATASDEFRQKENQGSVPVDRILILIVAFHSVHPGAHRFVWTAAGVRSAYE